MNNYRKDNNGTASDAKSTRKKMHISGSNRSMMSIPATAGSTAIATSRAAIGKMSSSVGTAASVGAAAGAAVGAATGVGAAAGAAVGAAAAAAGVVSSRNSASSHQKSATAKTLGTGNVARKEGFGARILSYFKQFALTKADETKYFEPRTWSFWRGIIMYFFLFSVVGHWMEIPYCLTMHSLFGIVEADYAIWADPLYVPYWVYGIGAAAITLTLLPMKIRMLGKRKTFWGACIEFFIVAVILCAALECVIGLIINQPDQFGEYPYWNNSVLPFNILGQAWLVNDIFLGIVSLAYVWFIFPFLQKACKIIGEKASNRAFVFVLALFTVICILSYA